MTVRYDPVLAERLAGDIAARWSRARVRSLEFDRARRQGALRFQDGSRLVALFHPEAGHVLAWPPDVPLPGPACDTQEEHRFRRLVLGPVWTPDDERLLCLDLLDPAGQIPTRLVAELQTNQLNLIELAPLGAAPQLDGRDDVEWRVVRALWPRETRGRSLRGGQPYDLPEAPPRSTPRSAEEVASTLTDAANAQDPVRTAVLRAWRHTSSTNVDWLLAAEGAATIWERYRELRTPGEGPGTDGACRYWLLPTRHGLQPYPHPLGHEDAEPVAGDLLDAMRAALEHAASLESSFALHVKVPATHTAGARSPAPTRRDDEEDAHRLELALRKRLQRERKRVAALERQLEEADDPEEARALGHLLLARKDLVARGADRVRLQGFDGEEVEVELAPELDAVGNAERLFEEARRRERARDRLPGVIAAGREKVDDLDAALDRLPREGPGDDLWSLAGGRPIRLEAAPAFEQRLPYTAYRSSGGLEIRVGRGARDNDQLTFKYSAPDDIWMHARQVPGAHVVLRWGRKDENPPGKDLAEAAVLAALNSQARGSGTVAIDWTRRKYVRKPRKAPRGTVTLERARTLFVEPDPAVADRLRVD